MFGQFDLGSNRSAAHRSCLAFFALVSLTTNLAHASGTCGSNDLIMRAGFEPLAEYRINFLTDANTVFTDTGQEFTFAIEYVDDQGTPIDSSSLEWCLEDDTLLSVSPSGLSATVLSTGFELGSIDLIVRDPKTSIQGTATVMFADLTPEAIYLNSDWVLDNGASSGDVILVRNAVTEQIQPGDVLISGDKAGLLVRVLTVSLTPGEVILTVEPVSITDAFENLDLASSIQAQSIKVEYSVSDKRVSMITQSADGALTTESFRLDDIQCKTEADMPYPLQLSDASIDWSIDIKLDGSLKITTGTVEEFSFFDVKTVTLKVVDNTLSFGAALNGKVTCELPLPSYETPTLPLSVFSFGLGVQPKLGVTAEGAITSPSFSISGPSGRLTSQVKSGFRYTDLGGWEEISEQSSNAKGSLFAANMETESGFTLGSSAYGGLGFEMIANLGKGIFSYELARVEFIELLADVTLGSELKTPLDPLHRDYTGPNWGLTANVKGDFKVELTGGGLADLLAKLDLPVTISIGGPIFDPVKVPLADSPKLGSIALNCTPPSCYLDTGGMDQLSIAVTTNDDRSGQVTYLASRNGAANLVELTAADLFHSSSLGQWSPTISTPDGQYRLYMRVQSDALSAVLPYVLPTTEDHSFEIGPTATLSVEKLNQEDGVVIEGGRVTSEPEGIDCGEVCASVYPSGSLITLTASDLNGWQFLQWADDSGACPGSTDPNCMVIMDENMTAKAVFESLSDQAIREHFLGRWLVWEDPYFGAGSYLTEEEPNCYQAVNLDYDFDGYLYDILERRIPVAELEFLSDGAGLYRGINIIQLSLPDNCVWEVGEIYEPWANFTWSVSSGVMRVTTGNSFINVNTAVPELREQYNQYDFPRPLTPACSSCERSTLRWSRN